MLDEEEPGAVDAGLDEVALDEGVSEGENGIVDVLLDVVGDVLQHHVDVFDVGVPRPILVDGRLAEEFEQVERHLPFLFLQGGKHQVINDLEDGLKLREAQQLADQCLIELRNDQYIPLIVIFLLEVFSDLRAMRRTREEVLYSYLTKGRKRSARSPSDE